MSKLGWAVLLVWLWGAPAAWAQYKAAPVPAAPIMPHIAPMPMPVPMQPSPGLSPSLSMPKPPAAIAPSAPSVARPATNPKGSCTLRPQEQWCRVEARADGGGDGDCNCGRDYCYDERRPDGSFARRVCQKK